MPTDPLAELHGALCAAADAMRGGVEGAVPSLERPRQAGHGDYSTNAAMLLAPVLSRSPREVAEELREDIADRVPGAERIEVAGPGFLNLTMSSRWYREAVASVIAAGEAYGSSLSESGRRILVEFVSANPTGPLHVGHGRQAAVGDSLVRILERAGAKVEREFYVNDAGGQIERFAASIAARMLGEEPPKDGYAGEYVAELADRLAANGVGAEDLSELGRHAVAAMRASAETTLGRFRVKFDSFASESEIRASGKVEETLKRLRGAGRVYESEGAIWLRTSDLGDEKDRVLIRSDGQETYFLPDIAYHRDKLERGAEHLIDVLGSDHHGYVPRMRAALVALGFGEESLETMLLQFVHLVEGGEKAQMSKRSGEFVALDALVDDIGVDAARFLMLQRSHDTAVDLDLALARSHSQDNPVYYVQYAHARIAGILHKAAAERGLDQSGVTAGTSRREVLEAAAEAAERALAARILALPWEVAEAAGRRAPHRLVAFSTAMASDFHAFYRDCRVVGAEPATEMARLGLCLAAKTVIATTLGLLGVGAPERM